MCCTHLLHLIHLQHVSHHFTTYLLFFSCVSDICQYVNVGTILRIAYIKISTPYVLDGCYVWLLPYEYIQRIHKVYTCMWPTPARLYWQWAFQGMARPNSVAAHFVAMTFSAYMAPSTRVAVASWSPYRFGAAYSWSEQHQGGVYYLIYGGLR